MKSQGNVIRVTERSQRVMQAGILTWKVGYLTVTVMKNEVKDMQPLIDKESDLEMKTFEAIKGEDADQCKFILRDGSNFCKSARVNQAREQQVLNLVNEDEKIRRIVCRITMKAYP